MNDELDYVAQWHPTHVITKDEKLVRVCIGTSMSLLGGFGLYVADEDWDKINHDKAYIFIHNPDAKDDDIDVVDWDELPDTTGNKDKKTNREHVHLWQE